jgi:FdrA protein
VILAFPGMQDPPPLPPGVTFAGSLEAAAALAAGDEGVGAVGVGDASVKASGVGKAGATGGTGATEDVGATEATGAAGGLWTAGAPQSAAELGSPSGGLGAERRGSVVPSATASAADPPSAAASPADPPSAAASPAHPPSAHPCSADPPTTDPSPTDLLAVTPGAIRGLFSGGTLCYEAMAVVAGVVGPVASNIPLRPEWRLADPNRSEGHTFVDFGDDAMTEGRAHPMIDPGLRNERFRREAADPETGVVLLDVVLGYGANPDPAGELAPLVERALADRPGGLSVVVSLCGAAGDPQGLDGQAATLRAAGALVTRSSAQAARLALAAAGLGEQQGGDPA